MPNFKNTFADAICVKRDKLNKKPTHIKEIIRGLFWDESINTGEKVSVYFNKNTLGEL